MSQGSRLRMLESKVQPFDVGRMSDEELRRMVDAAGPRVARAVRAASDAELQAIVAGKLTWPDLVQRQAHAVA